MDNRNNNNNDKIAFTGDQHYYHKNIIELCGRPFKTIYENNERLISNHNSVIYDDSWEAYFLGDVSFRCSAEDTVKILKKLNGKIHIILGNHDKPLRQAVKRGLLKDMIGDGKLEIIGSIDPNIITAYQLSYNKHTLILSHYAYRTWNRAFRGSIHLYGHSHNNLPPLYRSFDVGVDANDYYPITISEVLKRAEEIGESFSEK